MDKNLTSEKNPFLILPERVDSFNFEAILEQVKEELGAKKSPVTLNFTDTRFVSLPFIKKLAQMAKEARAEGCPVTLLNATEKVKKQIGIFSDLQIFQLKRAASKREWPALDESAGS